MRILNYPLFGVFNYMKPSLLYCILALLILAAFLAACNDDPATVSTDPTSGDSATTTVLPIPEATTITVPQISSVTPPGSDTDVPDGSSSFADSSLSTPDTDEPITVPLVTTTESPVTTTVPVTTPPVTTPPVTTTKATTPKVTTTKKPVTTTKPVTTAKPEPPAPEVHWVVTCNEYINLRKEASTASATITRIQVGESVELIQFTGSYAKVKYNGKTGYVNASYITRPEGMGTAEDLTVVQFTQNYSHQQMMTDLAILAEKFPDRLTLSSIGTSEEGRDLALAILGNPDAEHKVFLQAAIHGREHVVSQIAMGEIDYILHHWDMELENGMTVGELLDQVAIHVVPMSNPDGVTISQTATLPPPFASKYTSNTAVLWKANAKGIDLNGNFDALWEKYDSIYHSTSPAYAGYKGTAPECASESKALADHLRAGDFDATLSYHTSGSLIYWSFQYDQLKQVNDKSKSLGTAISKKTGYGLGNQASSSTAGFKDYAMMALGIPSLTIEFAINDAPAPMREYEQIWARGKNTLLTTAQWVLENQ